MGKSSSLKLIKSDNESPSTEHEKLLRAEMLLGISKEVAAKESLGEMLAALIEIAVEQTGAERGTLFLNDPETEELYSYFAQGNIQREIRLLNTKGIAGYVFQTGEGAIIVDPYNDPKFDRTIDEKTGFKTESILCAPIRTAKGEVIGVIQTLNKKEGEFEEKHLTLLEAMATQAANALQSSQIAEKMKKSREQEMEFLNIVTDVTSEIDLSSVLQKVMKEATRMLKSDRSTLFLNDEKTGELWSEVGEGLNATQIRFPNHMGIAGAVFTSGETINIPHAYADLRFNPAFDKKTGYFTRSILCVPLVNKNGKVIGVTQVLNKRGGPFTEEDESRLKAFTSQVSIALENATLFKDVQNMKNYNESMLESMSNGVITMDEDGQIVTANAASLRIMKHRISDVLGKSVDEFFGSENAWLIEKLKKVTESQKPEVFMDAEVTFRKDKVSANFTLLPLLSGEKEKLGSMVMMEDISSEKRMKSTMSRYMDPSISDKLLDGDQDILGGKSTQATVLFSDIRGFTPLTEELGAQGTVKLLNEYFTIMVDCIQKKEGMLDKFIGDAIMAAFGTPIPKEDDADRGVKAAIDMIRSLQEWNAKRAAEGKRLVDMGIGLNTDSVVSGNIGSPKRMDYTLIGDGVNLAARLESACKQYSARILISENTHELLKSTYRTREVDKVVVKGKTEPVGVFEVLDYHTDESFPNMMEVLKYFQYGLKQYREQKWDMAIEAFREALNLNPEDHLSQTYIERSEALKASPPEEDWDGVWVMKTK